MATFLHHNELGYEASVCLLFVDHLSSFDSNVSSPEMNSHVSILAASGIHRATDILQEAPPRDSRIRLVKQRLVRKRRKDSLVTTQKAVESRASRPLEVHKK
jgi:hypothetical protein